jgi:Na+-transporting NADH:ubiquinone oxidoreductase subunit NqrB
VDPTRKPRRGVRSIPCVWHSSGVTTATAHSVRVGAQSYPLLLPSLRDPRLHLAAVIVSIHVLGQIALGFRVSVPQILIAILTCAVIEVVWTFARDRSIVWPASAMLTGSGVALILRIVGQERGDHWTFDGWWWFALIAGFALVSKYLIRWRGTHVFNPSNFGLVVAFLVVGSNVIEPLDFWWGPVDAWLVLSYAIIIIGGLAITSRLDLLPMAATFWIAFASFIGVLAASGHCMTTAWSLQPVCDGQFWRVVALSPEVLIFLFFMITDPKTIPEGRLARIVFAGSIAALSVLLIAPQTQEFGAKVALLSGLVLLTPVRSIFDRVLHEGRAGSRFTRSVPRPRYVFSVGAVFGATLVLASVGMVAAGAVARPDTGPTAISPTAVDVDVDPSSLPTVTVSTEASALEGGAAMDPSALAVALAGNLQIEGMAMLRADTSMLRAADTGERLIEMEGAVQAAATAGRPVVDEYRFDTMFLDVAYTAGPQGGASLMIRGTGTVDHVSHDETGTEVGRSTEPFDAEFVLTVGSDGRWLLADVHASPGS